MTATVSRTGNSITRIRFEVTSDKPHIQYLAIIDSMPDDQARRDWLAKTHNIAIVDGWAEVTPR